MSALIKILSGDQSYFGGPVLDAEDAARARADQINALCRYTRGIMVVNIVNAIVFVAAGLQSEHPELSVLWGFAVILYGSYFYLRATRLRVAVTQMSERTIRRAVFNAFLLGALWSLLPVLFFDDGSQALQLLVICLCTGYLCGGAFVLASIPIAAIAFMMPIVGSLASIFLGRNEPLHYLIALLMFMYLFVLVRAVVSHGQEMLAGLVGKYSAQREAKEDPLTRLPNRAGLVDTLQKATSRLNRFGEPFAVLYLDLDKFKEVNDELGHIAGDQILLQVAERLNSCIRDSDTVARLGGDEFAIVGHGISTPKAAVMLADRILKAFAAPFFVEGVRRVSSTSIGISLAPSDGHLPEVLLRNADAALYRAKRDGRGVYCFYEDEDAAAVANRRALERDLRVAIGTNEIFLEYQPIYSLTANCVEGFEALVRWTHPQRGPIEPTVFIPIAEEAGLMQELGEQILLAACREAAAWPAHMRLAVNFSVTQFRSDTIHDVIMGTLAACGMDPQRLEIEITESVFMAQAERAVSILEGLSRLGVQISLDDFGTGYSSLTSLRKLPLNRLKIDRSFVADVATDPECAWIVCAVLGLAANMQIGVTAEGAETAQQIDFLRLHQCDEVQGFIISRPLSAVDANKLAHDRYRVNIAA
ncbi:MAG: EAL domain-containing protein [Beijerinckiaceae bacterium]|jgi:diguanylate cyclase|nr:EAL domain-containing protein [Beijerinckiaceae bacterium]